MNATDHQMDLLNEGAAESGDIAGVVPLIRVSRRARVMWWQDRSSRLRQ